MRKLLILGLIAIWLFIAGIVYAVQLCVDVPDSIAIKARDCICARTGYQEQICNEQSCTPNPVTKLQHAKRAVRKYIQNEYEACGGDAYQSGKTSYMEQYRNEADTITAIE